MSLEPTFPYATLWTPRNGYRLQRSWSQRSGGGPICGGRLEFSLPGSGVGCRLRRMPARTSTSHVCRSEAGIAARCSQHDDHRMPWHWPFRRSRSPWRHQGIGRLVLLVLPVLAFAAPSSSTIDRSDFLLLSVSLSSPFGLALARAETLRPAPGAVSALRHHRAPSGFRLPRQHFPSVANPAPGNLAGPPEKARPQSWELQPLAVRVPKPNGQKRSN
jgi:hypothetical protein